jgi:NADH-ubiquinone oxidoreductase chain 6
VRKVYVGAIVVLFLFVVMMLNIKIAKIHENVFGYLSVGGIIGLYFLLEIFFIINNDYVLILPTKLSTTYLTYTVYVEKIQSWTNLETLDNLFYTTYFILFLVSSLILLVVMIRAIVLTMYKTTQVKR